MNIRHLLLSVALLMGCGPAAMNPVAPEPLDTDKASATPCLLAEQNLLKLGCKDSEGRPLGGPNKAGESFHAICQNAVANHVDMNPVCIANVKICAEVNSCPR